ncbi:MAG: DUF371 domain-containing protein [Halodesulfurarchaeum sp.]
MTVTETVHAVGHANVTATHDSTFEVTTDDYLTPAGDCIFGIEADAAPADFDAAFVEAARDDEATITATIDVRDRSFTITGRGDTALAFENERSMVGRTSTYVDDRTIMLEADAAATDIPRDLVAALSGGARVTVRLSVE